VATRSDAYRSATGTDGSWRAGYESREVLQSQKMSEEQLAAFIAKVKEDAGLQEKLNAATDSDSVMVIANEAGFLFSADELQRAHERSLTEEELEGVTGGLSTYEKVYIECGGER